MIHLTWTLVLWYGRSTASTVDMKWQRLVPSVAFVAINVDSIATFISTTNDVDLALKMCLWAVAVEAPSTLIFLQVKIFQML